MSAGPVAAGPPAGGGRSRSFGRELGLLALDKLVFALLIALAVFFLNGRIEEQRAQTTFAVEFAKEQVNRVVPIVSLQQRRDAAVLRLARAERAVVAALQEQDAALAEGDRARVAAAERQLEGTVAQMQAADVKLTALPRAAVSRAALNANRFWLGQRLYERLGGQLALEQRAEALLPALLERQPASADQFAARVRELDALSRQAEQPLTIETVIRIIRHG